MALSITQHTAQFSSAAQLQPEDLAQIAAQGYKTVINNRPDGEGGAEQPTSAQIEKAATQAGLAYHYLPVVSGQMTEEQVQQMEKILANAKFPVLGFCRSGTRATNLWKMATGA
jgi:uncharacterized protein (TIGR01244 family)